VVYAPTKKDALAKLDALRAEARAGTIPEAGALTIGQLLDRWLESSRAQTGERTHEERERLVKTHLRPRLGGKKLTQLNAMHVEGFYADMRRDKVGPWAIRHAATVLHTALAHAVRLRLLPSNPAAAVPKPRVPKKQRAFLTDDQAKSLLAAAQQHAVYPLLVAALATGCRQGELLALTWGDIDLKKGALSVRRSLSFIKKKFVLKEPKSDASKRTIALPVFALEVLKRYKAEQLAAGLIAAPVFCTRTGNYFFKRNVLRSLRTVLKAARLPLVRFHDLRHTHASLLLSKGHSLRAVSQRLGHSNPALTLRLYAHCMPSDDATLADGFDRVIASS
jgi:integrase